MTSPRIQMLGLCRFSYPSEVGAFQHDHSTLEDLRAHLYGAARMETRFFFLENLVLPAVRQQTDPDFTLVLLAGDRMPGVYRDRLAALCADVPQIRIIHAPEGRVHREICREVMLAHRDPDVDAVAEFRLDDDDAVAVDFIAAGRRAVGQGMPFFDMKKLMCVDFSNGFLMAFDDKGVRVRDVQERMWTPAQIFCRHPEDPRSILDMHHMTSWSQMPVISIPNRPMYIRGAHGGNDSGLLDRPRFKDGWRTTGGGMDDRLRRRFAVDGAALSVGWDRIRASLA